VGENLEALFGLDERVAVVTGGSGTLGAAMADGLAAAGARVAVIARRTEKLRAVAARLEQRGQDHLVLQADVLREDHLAAARDAVLDRWGRLDILVNAAGGNVAAATLADGQGVFDLPAEAFRDVVDLNLTGTLLPCQIFGAALAAGDDPRGCIVNVSSMAAQRALTRVGGYGAAKAAVESLTRWLAVELARRHGTGLRVNAIAPGFFIGEQNRALLVAEDGAPTERGRAIIDRTPAARFGEAHELVGTLVWLCGPGAAFVNGVVVNVDGGFSAFSGV
jgi:NAD(P)-dependent dehydrogenase (short-subunit alcohol dehydrogenase family)